MVIIHQRITISRIRKPIKKTLNQELQWFGDSLGLFTERDKDNSCFRIFIELLKSTRRNQGLSSDELGFRTKLSRGTVVHHLHRLIEAGLVVSEDNKYFLRGGNLEVVVDELQKDLNRALDDLKKIAGDIDEGLGL